ncbi:Putative 115 kDa protein in type-1 retrotransposable element R1DM [Eumeta japonica]|uniref:115 kDa protein in type-1 retrotransposable element R1DM n=1 Tax=Eumeta variegata TaxID=151549 RepID=A0A4C1YTI6_EUMVA|nr:Putative 115 kDa protein in type-1 retrotransposable element R1DM [Eumeta japonica]
MVHTKKLKFDAQFLYTHGQYKNCPDRRDPPPSIARAPKATWGLNPEIFRTIYIAVIEPIVMYASCAWAPAARKLGVRKTLDALQRSIALKACRAYRSVSLHSALILARLLPLNIQVREVAKLYKVKRGKELEDIFADQELERLVDLQTLPPHPAHTSC